MRVRFEDLLERHREEIYRFLYRLTGNPSDASDVLQETFLRAFRAYGKLPEDANVRAWLYRIASHAASNERRSARTRRTVPLEEARGLAAAGRNPAEIADTRQLTRALAGTLRSLSPRQRTAFVERKYEGRSYAEIARLLGCSEETARAHVYQAMRRLRATLTLPASASRRRTIR